MNLDASQFPSQSVLIGVGLLVAAAVALCVGWMRRVPLSDVTALFGLSVVSAAVGSRLCWVMLDPAAGWTMLLEHPMAIVDLSRGGHNSFGALGGAALAVGLWYKDLWLEDGRRGAASRGVGATRALSMLDALVPAGLAGLSMARLGCLFDGCDFGRATALGWAVQHSQGTRAFAWHAQQGLVEAGAQWSAAVHPFGAYLAAGTLLIAAVAVAALASTEVTPGRVATWAASAYLILRLVVEWTREPTTASIGIAGASAHQLLAVAGLVTVALMVRRLMPCSKGPAEP
ncbi:MAG: prolipoprotein diacylglyceryl transferase family protein [Persicimonas sp.]